MIQFTDSGPTLHEHDLDELEAASGFSLPQQYRKFLLTHNGGRPTPDLIDIDGAEFKGTALHTFYGVLPGDESDDLISTLEGLEGCKENHLLPIAYDAFGRNFMLLLDDEHYGQVYYFDFGEGPPEPYFVANNFDEFLSKIRAPTPEELGEDETSEQAASEVRQDDDPDRNEPSAD